MSIQVQFIGNNCRNTVPKLIFCVLVRQAWVQFGVPMDQMGPLIEQLLGAVRDEELFDCSLDALSSIVSHPDTHKYVNLLKSLLERILTLQPLLAQLINEGSYEMANPLVCLYVTFGESHSRMMIDWASQVGSLIRCHPGNARIFRETKSRDRKFPDRTFQDRKILGPENSRNSIFSWNSRNIFLRKFQDFFLPEQKIPGLLALLSSRTKNYVTEFSRTFFHS